MKSAYERWQTGRAGLESLHQAARWLTKAGMELCDAPSERVSFLEKYLELTKHAEAFTQARHRSGAGTDGAVYRARYLRLDAEIQLLEARRDLEEASE